MDDKIIVTILIPVYKVEKYIEKCARSLFEQTYKDIEYIFVDDCSPDNSINILKRVLSDYPNRISHVNIIKQDRNRGLAAARNTAVENCNTDFLMHVDSDDWIDNNTVEELVLKQKETKADVISYDVKMHFQNNHIRIQEKPTFCNPRDLICALLRKEINSGVCGAFIRTSLYKTNKIQIVEGINMSEDFQVYPRLVYYSKIVSTLNGVYYHYNFENMNSYTHNETIYTCRQTWKTYDILEDFFSEKAPQYLIALKEGKKKTLARQLMSGCMHQTGEDIYSDVKMRLNDLLDVSNKSMRIQERVAIWIPCFMLLKTYMLILNIIKSSRYYWSKKYGNR